MISVIAENIKDTIRKKGFKQVAIARRAGFKEYEFSNMLNGRKTIKADDVLPIAEALGVEPNDLLKILNNNQPS